MTQVDELRGGTRQERGITAEAQRVFRVWTPSEYAALRAEGVPPEGSGHPDDATLVANSRVAVREPAHGACLVTVNYERLPFAGEGDGDTLAVFDTVRKLGRVSIDLQSERVVTQYPILRPRFVAPVAASPADPPPAPKLAWKSTTGAASRVRTVLTIRTAFNMQYIPSVEGLFAAFLPVTNQTDRLHVIGSRLYQFSCRRLNQATEPDGITAQSEVWNAEYSWTHDPGVLVPGTLPQGWGAQSGDAIGNDDIRLPRLLQPGLPSQQRYIVPPWCDVLTGPLELPDQSLTDPQFYARLVPDIDAMGWQGLPGVSA